MKTRYLFPLLTLAHETQPSIGFTFYGAANAPSSVDPPTTLGDANAFLSCDANALLSCDLRVRTDVLATKVQPSTLDVSLYAASTLCAATAPAPTCALHRSDDSTKFYGHYAHIRKALDSSYHDNYSRQRQRLQDEIIQSFLALAGPSPCRNTPNEQPWLVFTAGAMGVGKSYTMKKLTKEGRLPSDLAFVDVDPDAIRRFLPEFHEFVKQCPEQAGELTQKEAGCIAEILTLASLERGRNVMVDGSLRDAQWYKDYIARLRRDYPKLRISILHVTAPREAIFQRAAERALRTGRVVPHDLLALTLEQVPKAVNVLQPIA